MAGGFRSACLALGRIGLGRKTYAKINFPHPVQYMVKRTIFQRGNDPDSYAANSYHSNLDIISNHTNLFFNEEMSLDSLESNFNKIIELIRENSKKNKVDNHILHFKLSSIGNLFSLAKLSDILSKSENLRNKFIHDIINGLPENTSLITRNKVHHSLSQIFLEVEFDDPEKWLWIIDLKKNHGVDFSRLLHADKILAESFKTRHNVGSTFNKYLLSEKSNFDTEPVFIDLSVLLERLNVILQSESETFTKFVFGGDSLIHPITRRIALEAMRVYNKDGVKVFIEYSTHNNNCYENVMRDIEFCVRDNISYGLQLTHESSPLESSLTFPLLNMSNFTELMNEILIKHREESLGNIQVLIYTQNEIVVKYAMETMRIMQIDPESGLICFAKQREYSKRIGKQIKNERYPQISYKLTGDKDAIKNHKKEFEERSPLL